jgi:hypothetical protein
MSGPENFLATGTAITPSSVRRERPKATFNKEAFDTLVRQKGYPVYIDKTVKCPCVDKNSGQAQPGCKNCGGSGWVVYNRRDTYGVIHSMNRDTQFKEWSMELIGTASFTTYHEVKLAYMDIITLQTGELVFDEIVHLNEFTDDNQWRGGLRYRPLIIESAFLFETKDTPLRPLSLGTDYVIENNQILRVIDTSIFDNLEHPTHPQIALRYSHRPQFLVIDMPRMTISSLARDPKSKVEGDLQFPIHAIIRPPHYVINKDSNDGTYLFDNSFVESGCGKKKIYINGQSIAVDVYDASEIPGISPYKGLIIFDDTNQTYLGWAGADWINLGPDNFWEVNDWD